MTISSDQLLEHVQKYDTELHEECAQVIKSIFDRQLNKMEFAVIGANIARQVYLASQFSQNSNLWTIHLAPAFLRCMYELHVRIMWLIEAPEKNCKAFVKAGFKEAEQLSLTVAKHIQTQPEREELPSAHASIKAWLDEQSTHFPSEDGGKLLDVRKMAEKLQGEAMTMYRMYNSSLSPAVHSSWNFVEQVNLTYSTNPLHRFVRIPKIHFPPLDVEYLLSAAYFADQTLQISRGSEIEMSAFKSLIAKLKNQKEEEKNDKSYA